MKRKLHVELDDAARLALLFALLVAVCVGSMLLVSWHSSRDVVHKEALRLNQSLVAAIEREKVRVVSYLDDHDDWDDEILEEGTAVRVNGRDIRLVEADGNFDAIWLLNADKRTVLTFVPEEVGVNRQHFHHEVLHGMTENLGPDAEARVEILSHHGMAGIYGIARLGPDSGFASLLGGNRTGYLIMQADISGSYLAGVKRALQLQSLSIRPEQAKPGQVLLRDNRGKVVSSLAWIKAEDPGPFSQSRFNIVVALSCLLVVIGIVGGRQLANSFRSMSRQARIDHLSKLPNRFELLRQMRKKRNAEDFAALALIDLDAFKAINDYHGHRTGDAVIRHVAKLLLATMPASSMVARLGGDEFAIFFMRDGELAEASLNGFLLKLSEPVNIDGCAFKLGGSIGLTQLGTSKFASEALRQADIAMYAAKKRGKMQVVTYDETMEAPLREMLEVKEELYRAMERNEITVKYQPIISTRTGETEVLEALARWSSPVRGNVPADLFIKVAEEFGLIGKLGELILQKVIDDLEQLPDVRVALNVSTAQIATFEFIELLEQHIESGKIRGDALDIEITETHLVHDPAIIHEVMLRLSQYGVRFVLDDFGTGYASVGFLRQFPFHAVKIDRQIIDECLISEQSRAVLASIVSMAHAFGMIVVAEGIETERHVALARTAGCDQMQGWYFGRAVSASERSLHARPEGIVRAA